MPGAAIPSRAPRVIFFFNDTATTEIYILSLHDALPIYFELLPGWNMLLFIPGFLLFLIDRKSTRLNSSHLVISYAVFYLKKKPQARVAPGGRRATHRARSWTNNTPSD